MTLVCLQAAVPAGNGIIGTPSNGEKAAGSGTNGSSTSGSSSSLVLSGEGVTEALLQRLLEQMHGPEVELKGVQSVQSNRPPDLSAGPSVMPHQPASNACADHFLRSILRRV